MGNPDQIDFEKDTEENPNSFYGLPLNCIINIFHFLNDTSRRNLGLTCKKMDYILQGFVGFTYIITGRKCYFRTEKPKDSFYEEFTLTEPLFQIRFVYLNHHPNSIIIYI